jgi:hypothetical protein
MCISFLPEYPISADMIEQMMKWKPNTNPLLSLGGGANEEWTRFLAHVTALRNTQTLPRLCEALCLASREHNNLARRDLMVMGECISLHFNQHQRASGGGPLAEVGHERRCQQIRG